LQQRWPRRARAELFWAGQLGYAARPNVQDRRTWAERAALPPAKSVRATDCLSTARSLLIQSVLAQRVRRRQLEQRVAWAICLAFTHSRSQVLC